MDVDSATALEMEIQSFGLSFYYAAVVMAILAITTMVVATIAVYGLSFFFSSVADAAATITDVSNIIIKMATELSVASFFLIFSC